MKIFKSQTRLEFFKFIWKNCMIFAIVLASVLLISISYIGFAYTVNSAKMLSYLIKDFYFPFHSYAYELYVKLYWDETLTLPEYENRDFKGIIRTADLEKTFNYTVLFKESNLDTHKYAAEKGNKNAQFYVANNIYLYPRKDHEGSIEDMNYAYYEELAKEKIKWLSKASNQGHIEAMDSLGSLYEKGALALTPDTIQALNYFAKAAERGDLFALTKRGVLLVASKDTTGLEYLRKADFKGYIPATIELGKFYYPLGTPTNPFANKDKSKSYFSKAKSNDNTGIANYYLGWLTGGKDLYYNTPRESMEYFLRGARQGYNPARYMLGYLMVEYGERNRSIYRLETPPYQYSIESFDQLRRDSKYANRGASDSKSDYYNDSYYNTPRDRENYSIYCGWAWIIIAAEDGYDEAIKYIEKHRDNKSLHKVLSCRDSNVESIIDVNKTMPDKSSDEQNEGN